ncbi:3-oxoacyl-[acyl-carrier protein] reductase [Actinomycetospora succinea]|uniref:3-oxoacyl-[acyl-carrier protein] reductase n=1 Tax=Actinomycetospora succinea TaxID=663603 RepID=A0A4R6UXX6_9PSEU|nr:SDR family NAD(P)-dependent oxidoreductase [Actinomycetospora succinea]TDQ50889.1 3-oxoacyl-[acyl-carrier protein] reductase [Actinomycetospora succinea]
MDLSGQTAVVTGAGSGIGKGIAKALLERGANVVGLEIEPANIKSAGEELAGGHRLAWSEGSVAVAADVEAAFDLAESRYGTVDHLVNNAGTASLSLVIDTPEEEWDLIVDTCLKGTFLCTKAFARRALAAGKGGTVVNISSLNAIAATDGLGHYCAAKAGVMNFTKVAAGELGRHGIRVNAIGPGTVNTPLGAGFTVGQIGQEFLDRTLVGPPRHQEPSDIADVALFLMSPTAGRITGHFIPVDGGQHVRGLHSYWDVAEAQGIVARPAQ